MHLSITRSDNAPAARAEARLLQGACGAAHADYAKHRSRDTKIVDRAMVYHAVTRSATLSWTKEVLSNTPATPLVLFFIFFISC